MTGAIARARPGATVVPPPERPVLLLVRWAFYLLVFSIPFEFPDRSFPIEIPTIAASVFLLVTLLQPRACYARKPAGLLAFGVYLYVFCVSAGLNGRDAVATDLITPDYWNQVVELFLRLLQVMLAFWASYNLMRSQQVGRTALVIFTLACIVRALLPLLGIARTAHPQWGGGERITALGQNPDNSASILAAGLVALLGLRYALERPLERGRWLVWPAFALIVLSVVDTGSRGGLLALAAGLIVFAFGGARTAWRRMRNAVVTVLAMGALVYLTYTNDLMRRRFDETLEHGRLAGRERIYPELVQMFRERPLMGWGPVNNKYELGIRLDERLHRRRDAHNLILEVLTSTGVVGGVPFLVGLGLCARGAWRARRRAHGVLALALLASVMTSNMSGNLIASQLLWLVLAYGLASLGYGTGPAPPAPESVGRPIRRLGAGWVSPAERRSR